MNGNIMFLGVAEVAEIPGFESRLSYLLRVFHQASHFTSVCLSFLLWTMWDNLITYIVK